METRRTHDSLYLNESRYENTKRLFEFIVNKSINKGQNDSITSICDVGCAAGEFLYYLNSLSDNYNLTGLDVMKELLDKSKKYVPNATYVQGSVMDEYNFLENQFDITFMTGVHMIFDEFETPINNLIYWTKPNGKVIISGLFNEYPVDVYIKYKESVNYSTKYFEQGWNMFSIDSIASYLKTIDKIKSFHFEKFDIDIDLQKQSDVIRSWTFKDEDRKRIITNGLSIIQQQYSLIIKL